MAGRCSSKFNYSYFFLFSAVLILFGKPTGSFSSAKPGRGEFTHSRSFGSVSGPTAPPPGVRLHPGVVAAVVIVAAAAVVAAVFIIRKYCFPQSDTTYRYSVLRRMEEQRGGGGGEEEEESSDEALLE